MTAPVGPHSENAPLAACRPRRPEYRLDTQRRTTGPPVAAILAFLPSSAPWRSLGIGTDCKSGTEWTLPQAVARYCIGHDMKEVGKHLKYSHDWVVNQLDYAGVGVALGGGPTKSDPLTGGNGNVAKDVPRLVREFAPSVNVKLNDDGKGNQKIDTVEGDDAKAFQPYLDHYVNEGHTPAAATRLAKAEWAAEAAGRDAGGDGVGRTWWW